MTAEYNMYVSVGRGLTCFLAVAYSGGNKDSKVSFNVKSHKYPALSADRNPAYGMAITRVHCDPYPFYSRAPQYVNIPDINPARMYKCKCRVKPEKGACAFIADTTLFTNTLLCGLP